MTTKRGAAFTDLTDDELVTAARRLATVERHATAALIRSLIEIDARQLYRREGCASLYTFCTQVLHLCEGATYTRIEIARAARDFPAMLDALEEGTVTLTALRMLAPHLNESNRVALLEAAALAGAEFAASALAASFWNSSVAGDSINAPFEFDDAVFAFASGAVLALASAVLALASAGASDSISGLLLSTETFPVSAGIPRKSADIIKIAAAAIVIFESTVVVPRGARAELAILLVKSAPASVLPGCSSTAATSTRHERKNTP